MDAIRCALKGVKLKLDIVAVPSESYCGTADSLRLVKDKIKVRTKYFFGRFRHKSNLTLCVKQNYNL